VSVAPARERRPGALLPLLSAVLGLLLDLVPVPGTAPGALGPWLLLSVCFFWIMSRPTAMPPLALFGLGIAQDLAAGAPPGVGAAVLLLARTVALPMRGWLLAQPAIVTWASFLLVVLLLTGVRWLLTALALGRAVPMTGTAAEIGLTVACYPAVAALLARAQRRPALGRRAAGG
jgi:rod shape-determining protein MreD